MAVCGPFVCTVTRTSRAILSILRESTIRWYYTSLGRSGWHTDLSQRDSQVHHNRVGQALRETDKHIKHKFQGHLRSHQCAVHLLNNLFHSTNLTIYAKSFLITHSMRRFLTAIVGGLLLSFVPVISGQNTTDQDFNKRRTLSVGIVSANLHKGPHGLDHSDLNRSSIPAGSLWMSLALCSSYSR